MNKRILTISFLLIVFLYKSQSASAYSYFGLGVMDNVDNARNLSLGGTGLALDSESNINFKNPATNIAFAPGLVIFDVGGVIKYNTTASGDNKDKRFLSNYNNLGMGFRVSPKVFVTASLQPTSTSDYKISSTAPIEGSNSEYPVYLEGSGGIANVALGVSYKVLKDFSIGLKLRNNFGSITRTENITISSSTLTDVKIMKNEYYTGFGSQFGFLYKKSFKDHLSSLSIGGTFDLKTKLTGTGTLKETHNLDSETIRDVKYNIGDAYLPYEYGLGVSYLHKNKLLFTGDFQNKNWAGIKYGSTYEKYYNQSIYALGLEILPQKRIYTTISDGFSYRFGINYDTGYYKISSVKIDKIEASAGLGIPFKNGFMLNVGYSYGIRGMSSAIIKENYHSINLSLNFINRWFQKTYYQ
jgi:hypothetical protein